MFFWPFMEPSDGQFDWTYTDADVANAARAGVTTMPYLIGSPPWLSGCTDLGATCQHVPPTETAAERDAWTQMLTAVVGRYGPGGTFWQENPGIPERPISYWQIWNEPNLPPFMNGDRSLVPESPARYAALLAISTPAIHAVDPSAKIVLAGLTHGIVSSRSSIPRFLDSLYAIGGVRKLFDVVAVHPYGAGMSVVKRLMNQTVRCIRRNHDNARTWVTEIGWSSQTAPRSPNGRAGFLQGLKGQAKLTRRSFEAFVAHRRAWRLDRVYYFSWRDNLSYKPDAWWANAGLRRSNLKPKPAWKAFQSEMSKHGGA
jgi:hypothetical protein